MNRIIIIAIVSIVSACTAGTLKNRSQADETKTVLSSNPEGKGPEIIVDLTKGGSFYCPLLAVWIEDENGKYIQTLYVSESVAKGIFKYARQENNKWITAPKRAPQTLPYWAHKRGVIASDGLYMPDSHTAVPDAYTGATPVKGFVLTSRADGPLPEKYKVMLEINQNWDWNEYWTNDKYPDDENYKMSCQPALVYEAFVDNRSMKEEYIMSPVGHSHYSGKTGELFTDLSTLTTALNIVESIKVRIR
jgi:hypothetical protein